MSEEFIPTIRASLSDAVVGYHSHFGDHTIIVAKDRVVEVMRKLKEEFEFEMLVDTTAVDYFGRQPRFEVVYHLNSLARNVRLRVKVELQEGEEIDSVSDVWPIANWLEREVWDMFGIRFRNHPDLKRILMYDEFEGHPLRKDYPINKRQPRVKLIRPEYDRDPANRS